MQRLAAAAADQRRSPAPTLRPPRPQGEYVPEQRVKLRHGDALVVTGLLDNIRLNYLR